MDKSALDTDSIVERLQPLLAELETDRQELIASRKRALPWLWAGFAAIILAVLAKVGVLGNVAPAISVTAIVVSALYTIIVLVVFTNKWKSVKQKIKQAVVSEVVRTIDPSMQFDTHGYISEHLFRESRLFSSPDRYTGEDLIKGSYGDTDFMMSEVTAEERRTTRDSDGNTRTSYSTIFKGFMMIADFHKDFHGRTYVLPDFTEKLLGSWLSKGAQKLSARGELVYLENVEFEKHFMVYSSDQVEARYILTPKLMESIMELRKKFETPVYVAFHDSAMTIALHWPHDYLEPDLYEDSPLQESEWIRRLVGEIFMGLDIIDQLDLNTRIWTKA